MESEAQDNIMMRPLSQEGDGDCEEGIPEETTILVNAQTYYKCLQTKKLYEAFVQDNFASFKFLLSSHVYDLDKTSIVKRFIKKQTKLFTNSENDGCSLFELILQSKESSAAKYISFIQKHFELWKNETFFMKEINGKFNIHHVANSGCVENLFSFLMFDWFDPSPNKMSYCLKIKFQRYFVETGRQLTEKLYEIIDDVEKTAYRDTCLRIIYQLVFELDEVDQTSGTVSDIEKLFSLDRIFEIECSLFRDKILKIITVFWLKKDERYEELKTRILETSSDEKVFFELAFMLKEAKNVMFERSFENYLKNLENMYGDYYATVCKPVARFLSIIAARQNMNKTVEVIHRKCPFIGINSTILTSFLEVQDFKIFNIAPFEEEKLNLLQNRFATNLYEPLDVEALEKRLQNTKIAKKELWNFLFGRNIQSNENHSDSIFEQILSTPNSNELIEIIWEKFELYGRQEILNVKNLHGKLLLNYIIDSKDDRNLLTFLTPKTPENPKFSKQSFYLKMQNDQFKMITGKTLFEHFLKICIDDVLLERDRHDRLTYKFFLVVFTFLEEISNFNDIKPDFSINEILELAENETFYLSFIEPNTTIDEEKENDLKQLRFYIDDLLGHIVAYGSLLSHKISDSHRERLLQLSPFFEMLFMIIDGKEDEFLESFLDKLEEIEIHSKKRYFESGNVTSFEISFLFIMFLCAMKNDQRNVIDRILQYENFVTVKVKFPGNMKSNETCYFLATKLLEHGHEIGKKEIPQNWITFNVFESFLDSQICYNNEDLIEINFSFLLHPHTRKCQVQTPADVDEKLIFWEDTEALEYVLNSDSLKELLPHPVISTYIKLKSLKYRNIFLLNFWMFLIFFVLPFALLFICHFSNLSSFALEAIICPIATLMLITRELFQLKYVELSLRKYLRQRVNWLEIILIISSVATLVCMNTAMSEQNFCSGLACITIILMTLALLKIIPYEKMQLHLMMLEKVARTFIRFFLTFFLILAAFTVCFYVLFGMPPKSAHSTVHSNTTEALDSSDESFKSFDTVHHAFMKVILMLSGEYSIEPFNLKYLGLGFFFFFVLATFVVYNLIVGLAIDDVQKLRSDSRYLTLERYAQQIMTTSDRCQEFYHEFNLHLRFSEQSMVSMIVWLSKLLIFRDHLLHKIDKCYVNIKTKEVTLTTDSRNRKFSYGNVDDETFSSIKEIINSQSVTKHSE